MTSTPELIVRSLGLCDYISTLEAMREFTESRSGDAPDELWLLEHYPVYTLGRAGKREHLLHTADVPVIETDRGGQVTYHGPGQLVVYVLLDLARAHLGVRFLVERLEQCTIDLLSEAGVHARRRRGAPGIYVEDRKIGALGLRVRRGRSYHGLALNVRMDLTPFGGIDPCGYAGLEVTQLADLGVDWNLRETAGRFVDAFSRRFGYAVRREASTGD